MTRWIINEINDTKLFTFLNILGISISTLLVLIFLFLTLGIEKMMIEKIQGEQDIFTIEVISDNVNSSIDVDEFYSIKNIFSKDLIGIFPIIYTNSNDLSFEEDKEKNNKVIISTKNYNSKYKYKDINNQVIQELKDNEIIVPLDVLDYLKTYRKDINQTNFKNYNFEITVKNSKTKQASNIKCKIAYLIKTNENQLNRVFTSYQLSEKIIKIIDGVIESKKNISVNGIENDKIKINRYDIILKNDIELLEKVESKIDKQKFRIQSELEKIQNVKQIIAISKAAFFIIMSIAIIVAMFNVIITLTANILKRKNEIGILKAIGASDSYIIFIYITHSIIITLIGFMIGLLLAFGLISIIDETIKNFDNLKNVKLFDWNVPIIIYTALSSICLSILASLIPARKISSIEIIDILRNI